MGSGRAYLEADLFDFANDLGPCREKSDGPGGQVSDMEVLLVGTVHLRVCDGG